MWHRTLFSTILALIAGLSLIWMQTDGLRAFTQESARRLSIEENPVALKMLPLELSEGTIVDWHQWQNRYVIVDFIYTRCGTVCNTLGHQFRQIQKDADDLIQAGKLILVSISFDPANDNNEELKAYIHRYSKDTSSWKAARAMSAEENKKLLAEFGVVVIADQWGGYVHNAALHLISPQSKLIKIIDYSEYKILISRLRRCIEKSQKICDEQA